MDITEFFVVRLNFQLAKLVTKKMGLHDVNSAKILSSGFEEVCTFT